MKCVKCGSDINELDNFCANCGEWTASGYIYAKDKSEHMQNSFVYRQDFKLRKLMALLLVFFVCYIVMIAIRGNNLFKPYFFIKREIISYVNGYDCTILNTNKHYEEMAIDNEYDAYAILRKDTDSQKYECKTNLEVSRIEKRLQDDYGIYAVSFCDMSLDEVKKIEVVIDRMYKIFPKMKGALTNITITNEDVENKYIASFKAMSQFVNTASNLNKVNKTQILLNSFYFLNNDHISTNINEKYDNYYVSDASWESIIAHELGHYITFKLLLKSYNLNDIILVNDDNKLIIDEVISKYNSGEFAKEIVSLAFNNFDGIDENLALNISKYAGELKNGSLVYDEVIGEAVHDYYLHGNNAKRESLAIINVINKKFDGVL